MASPKSKPKSAAAKQAKNKKQVKADAEAKKMRGAKGTKPVKAAKQSEETSTKLPGKKAIKDLSNKFMAASDDASVKAGLAGKIISEAVTKLHIDSAEFKRAHKMRLVGMENPARLHAKLQAFDYYREALDLDKLAGLDLFQAADERAGGNGHDEDEGTEEDASETESPSVAADAEEHEGAAVH